MPCLRDIVDDLIAEEARRAMTAVEVPRAPEVGPAADELSPINPHTPGWTAAQTVAALLAVAAGFFPGVFA